MKKFLILVALGTTIFSQGIAQTCDTLFNLVNNLDTATVLAADTGLGAGFLAGNNIYGDVAKAEAFPVADTGYYITSASFYFGYVTINPSDSNLAVTINAWDNTGVSLTGGNAPGNVLNSAVVTLGQIAQAVSAGKRLTVFFSGGTELTDTIYVGVVLPTTTGDTIALLTNSAPPGPDGNGWEQGANGAWNSYNNDWQVTSGSLGNYIAAGICNTVPTGTLTASFTSTGNASGCNPDSVGFVDNSVPTLDSWSWSFGDGTYSNAQYPIHLYASAGSYIVTELAARNAANHIAVYIAATATITVTPSPVIAATTTPPTSDTTFGSAYINVTGGTGHYFVTWSTSAIGDTLYNASAGTTYYVTVVDQNTCQTVDSIVIPYPTGIIRLSSSQQVKVYPNPASDVLNLEWSQKSNAVISILDLTGKVISSQISIGEMKTVCDIHGLATGDYILRVTDWTMNQQQSLVFTKL